MHSGFICQSIVGRKQPESNTILYLDPGFPVNKLQTKFLGLQEQSIDLFDYRGDALINKIEEIFSAGEIGGLLWSSPNNPTWVCLKESELEGIGNLLTKYDVIGIEDAAYFGMDYRQDYSQPGIPPFIPTIARYTGNYFLTISSSKIFSYAGQRIAITVISPELMEKRYKNLRQYFDTERIGHAFVHGGIYPTTAGVPQTPQYALAALFEAASSGDYNFLEEVKVYSKLAAKIKIIFKKYDFDLVYDKDMGEPIGDGFYFTVSRQGMTGAELLFQMLRYGMAGIPLSTTGSTREGIRICVSIIRESQLGEMENRLSALNHHLQPNPV
jgi:aspartate/methionine/tyrosine aminotransferase